MSAAFLRTVALALGALSLSCVQHLSPVEYGARLARDPSLTGSAYNTFACVTCHAEHPDASGAVLAGAVLAGAARRPSYWGGTELTLYDAVNVCLTRFMRGATLDPSTPQAQALYAWLTSLEADTPALALAQPFTVQHVTQPPDPGNATRGQGLYNNACRTCHGEPRTGTGATYSAHTIIPDDTESVHRAPLYTQSDLEQILVQKSRQGAFLGFAGVMPPFSTERLSDADLADIVAYLAPHLLPAAP